MNRRTPVLLLLALFAALPLQAAYVLRNGRLIDVRDIAEFPIETHYDMGIKAIKERNWDEAVHQFRIITISFPNAELAKDSLYFLGVSYYHINDMDLANQNLSRYLEQGKNAKYFTNTFRYKLAIAEKFRQGAWGHLFHTEKLPKLRPGTDDALAIYDEIANTLVNHELAAKALFAKGSLLAEQERFRDSQEAFSAITKRFPKTDLAARSYLMIGKTYLEQSQAEFQNPDLLDMAQVNLKHFGEAFPRDERLDELEKDVISMQEVFANGLYETGRFYERKNQPKASVLYYHSALVKFPDTKTALLCKERLSALELYAREMDLAAT